LAALVQEEENRNHTDSLLDEFFVFIQKLIF